MTKKKIISLVIFLFSMFVVFFMITQIWFWLDAKREISDVYLIQRALLKDLMFDFDNINDGDILMDKYILFIFKFSLYIIIIVIIVLVYQISIYS